jgi:hypothetical protein
VFGEMMKISKNLVIYFLTLLVFFVSTKGIYAASDRDTLEYIADKIDTNYTGIYSWRGTVVAEQTTVHIKTPLGFPDERYLNYKYNYAFDKVKGCFISSSVLQDEYAVYAGIKKHFLTPNYNFLSKNGDCYSFEWYSNRDVEVLSSKDGILSPTNSDKISRIVHLRKEPFSNVDMLGLTNSILLFDPFEKFSCDRRPSGFLGETSALNEIRGIIKGMHINKYLNFAERPQSNPDNIARLVTEGNKITLELLRVDPKNKTKSHGIFIFDMKQGYNVVEYLDQLTQADKVTQKRHWKCSYTQVNNFWIPKKTELDEFSNLARKVVVDWVVNRINEPIPDSEFTLQKMGVCRGDQLYDRRTEKITIISGDDFPPFLRKGDKKDVRNVKFPFVRFVIITLGAVLIITSILNIYRKRKVSRKDVKK